MTAFVTETHPIFRTSGRDDEIMGVKTYTVNRAFGIVEAVVVAFFTIELLCRFICNTKKIRFFRQPSNIVDVLAIAPFYFNIFGVQGGSVTSPFQPPYHADRYQFMTEMNPFAHENPQD